MSETAIHAPGRFCWVELATTDGDAAKKFYSGLLNWEFNETAGEEFTYTMLTLNGKDVGGLYVLGEEQTSQGIPSHWMSYVAVEDATGSTNKAESLGAEVIAGPMDVMDVGRMSVLKDPQGAVFAIWQALKHPGSAVTGEIGATCWFELATKGSEAAAEFYQGLFAWSPETQDMGPTKYTIFKQGDDMASGMMEMTPEFGDTPPHWLAYFHVKDCDASAKQVPGLGGNVICPPTDIPNVGRFAIIADPSGAVFAIITLEQPS